MQALPGDAPELPPEFFRQLLGLKPAEQDSATCNIRGAPQPSSHMRILLCSRDGCHGMTLHTTPHRSCFKCKKVFCETCSEGGTGAERAWLIRHSTEFIQIRDDIATEVQMQTQRDYDHAKAKVRADMRGRPYPSRKHVWVEDIDSDDDVEVQTLPTNRTKVFHDYCRDCCDGTADASEPLRTPAYDLARDDKHMINFLLGVAGLESRTQAESLMVRASMEFEVQVDEKKEAAVAYSREMERAHHEALVLAGRQHYLNKSLRESHKRKSNADMIYPQAATQATEHHCKRRRMHSRALSRSRSPSPVQSLM